MDALERFRQEFKGWVRAVNKTKGYDASPDEVLDRLEKRMPEESLRQIGAAFINGWLQNEPEPDRKYFVKESDREGPRGGQWMMGNVGEGRIDANLELHIQLADYGRLRTVAEQHGLAVWIEDQLMDITVYAGKKLLLYVENKATKQGALNLLKGMKEYGNSGFDLSDPDKGNDNLRKSKYLVRNQAYPEYFGLSAIGYEKMFRVEYLEEQNRFSLHETEMSLTEPLLYTVVEGDIKPRSVVDPLALELERLTGEKIWVSLGTGATAYNFYFPSDEKDAVVIGVYDDGRIWTDLKSLGDETANRLAEELSEIEITLDTSKEWVFWRKGGQMLYLQNEDPLKIAEKVVAALF
jgi:hypothetical protein